MSSLQNMARSSLQLSFQMAAVFTAQFNGDNAPLYGRVAKESFDYLSLRFLKI